MSKPDERAPTLDETVELAAPVPAEDAATPDPAPAPRRRISGPLPATARGERPVPPAGEEDLRAVAEAAHLPLELSDVSFPTAWRGYEPGAVDAYVRQVARTIADLQATQTPKDVVRSALDRVGEQTSAILREAEEAAERITTSSRTQAGDRLERADREAEEITRAARNRLRELDADADRVWLERQRLVDDVRKLADGLMRIAGQAEARFPAEEVTDPGEPRTPATTNGHPTGAAPTGTPRPARPPAPAAQPAQDPPSADGEDEGTTEA